MQETKKQPMILTLRMDNESQTLFDAQRELYFPKERNFLKAHLTLFHQLPDSPATIERLSGFKPTVFDLNVISLMNLGAGVAYLISSPELSVLHKVLLTSFADCLIPQDKQPLRPHVTIMNKANPDLAKLLIEKLTPNFKPFKVIAIGFDLWNYLGGPWSHEKTFDFIERRNA